MKKLIAALLCLFMVLSLAACGAGEINQALEAASEIAEILTEEDETSETANAVDEKDSTEAADTDAAEEADTEEDAIPAEEEAAETETEEAAVPVPDEDGWYYDLENVTAYLMAYGKLPSNYITKNEAQNLGWSGGSVQKYREGAAIGGSHYGNYEGLLPDGNYTECDLDTDGASSRGAKRLVFSDDGHYYYTEDHYESFAEVTFENGELVLSYDF